MYNGKYIVIGLVIFAALFTLPFWANLTSSTYTLPEVALPTNAKECVEDTAWMRANHMTLLNDWRDMVVREGMRVYTSEKTGKEFEASLQKTCMDCHTNKVEFCDKCHDANSVSPYCWDCHIAPRGNE